VKQVRGQQGRGAGTQGSTPGIVAVRRRRDTVSAQDLADGRSRDPVPEPAQPTLNAHLWVPRMLSSLVTWKIKDQAREPIPARTTGIARQSETRMPGRLLALTPNPAATWPPPSLHHDVLML
jgi:hypothetical protein